MSEHVRYITNEQGERVGVLLDMEAYQKLANFLTLDSECLNGLSLDELQALADSKLAPASQARLDELLSENTESRLSADEVAELDHLVAQIDQLTILKTRARYTLNRLQQLAVAS
jgi:molybdenum cofactor biosynthesis enzyme MoaA